MRTSAVALLAVAFAVILAVWMPRGSSAVAVNYGCGAATFTNRTEQAVRVSHGVPRSPVVADFTLAPGESATVHTNASNFRWWATGAESGNRLVGARPGVDLVAQCQVAERRPIARGSAGSAGSWDWWRRQDSSPPPGLGLARTGADGESAAEAGQGRGR